MTTQVSEKLFPNLSKSGMPALPGLYLPIISPASPKMPYKIPLPLFLILRLLCRSEPLRSLDISPSSLLLHAKDFIYVPRSNSIPTFTSSPNSPIHLSAGTPGMPALSGCGLLGICRPLKSFTLAKTSSQANTHTRRQKQNQLHSHDMKDLQQFVRCLPYYAPAQKHIVTVAYSI